MRLQNFRDGRAGVRATIGPPGRELRLAGWVDWRRPLVYLSVAARTSALGCDRGARGRPVPPRRALARPGSGRGAGPGRPGRHRDPAGGTDAAAAQPDRRREHAGRRPPLSRPPTAPPADGWRVRRMQAHDGRGRRRWTRSLALLFTGGERPAGRRRRAGPQRRALAAPGPDRRRAGRRAARARRAARRARRRRHRRAGDRTPSRTADRGPAGPGRTGDRVAGPASARPAGRPAHWRRWAARCATGSTSGPACTGWRRSWPRTCRYGSTCCATTVPRRRRSPRSAEAPIAPRAVTPARGAAAVAAAPAQPATPAAAGSPSPCPTRRRHRPRGRLGGLARPPRRTCG